MFITMAIVNGEMTDVTAEQIRAAFESGMCRQIHSYGDNCTRTVLSLDGQDIDTRGKAHSVWDQCWTQPVESLQQAQQLAHAAI